jgi:hypothetical protein
MDKGEQWHGSRTGDSESKGSRDKDDRDEDDRDKDEERQEGKGGARIRTEEGEDNQGDVGNRTSTGRWGRVIKWREQGPAVGVGVGQG